MRKLSIAQILIVLGLILTCQALAKSPAYDHEQNKLYHQYCEEYKTYLIGERYQAECFYNYHHFNSDAYKHYYSAEKALKQGQLRIGSANLWHPGTARSAFKDYPLLARIIDQWDLFAAQELVSVVARDLQHNNNLVAFLERAPGMMSDLREQVANNPDSEVLQQRLLKLQADYEKGQTIYREPGYLTILHELQKLDPSWSLLLAPRAEAAETHHVHEFTAFYYRATVTKPFVNPHCDEFRPREMIGTPYACIPHFYNGFMERDTAQVFSRRPFMANFESGDFKFTALTSHTVFTSPRDDGTMAALLRPSFGVDSYDQVPNMRRSMYARWAETKLLLEFMQRYEDRYRQTGLIYMGDVNLESTLPLWNEVLNTYPGSRVFIDGPTTISQVRYLTNGNETNGLASNLDHFIFKPESLPQCMQDETNARASTFNFIDGWAREDIERRYYVRKQPTKMSDEDDDDLDMGFPVTYEYDLVDSAEDIMRPHIALYEQQLNSTFTIRNNEVIWDNYRIQQRIDTLVQRVFFDQLTNRTYYRVYQELLSDHIPIVLNCTNNLR